MRARTRRVFRSIFNLIICAAVCFTGVSSFADSLTEGLVLPDFALVTVGSRAGSGSAAGLNLQSGIGPVNGAALIGDGSTANNFGGAAALSAITGGISISPPCNCASISGANVTMVPASIGMQAFSDAVALSNAAAALQPTQTFGNINSGSVNFVGNGGLNVIDVTSLQFAASLTLTGGPNDVFVINVSSAAFFNKPVVLNGVDPSHILWNFTGSAATGLSTVLSTSSGNVLPGTFLAARGGDFSLNGLNLTGQLINAGGTVQFNFGSTIPEFVPFQPIPEPSTLLLLGSGLAGLIGATRRKLRL